MINADWTGLDAARRALGNDIVNQAMTSALNKLATKASTAASRAIRDKYAIKAKDLRKRGTHNRRGLSIIRARRGRDMAIILSTGTALPLINFRVSPKTPEKDLSRKHRKGIRYRVVKAKQVRVRKAFVARMRSGHIGVFERTSNKRLPIRELFGPSIPQMFREQNTLSALARTITESAPGIIAHEIRFRAERAARRRS